MKMLTALLASTVLLAACSQAPSETATAPAATPTAAADATDMAPAASATGTVESIDIANGKITIAHGPVPALKWPAMTMAFVATPEQIQSVQAGQQVEFEFVSQDMKASLVSIHGR